MLEPTAAECDDQDAEDEKGDNGEHSPVHDAVEKGVDYGGGDDYEQGDGHCEGEDSGPGAIVLLHGNGVLAELGGDVSALDLAGGGAGQGVDDVDGLGDLEVDEMFLAEGLDVFLGGVGVQDDGGVDFFAVLDVGNAEADGIFDGGVLGENGVDLEGRYLFAAAVYQLLEAAGDAEVAEGVDEALVPGTEPAIGEGGGVGLGVVAVAVHDVGALDDDLAALATREVGAGLVYDGDLDTCTLAHGTSEAFSGWEGVGGHLV